MMLFERRRGGGWGLLGQCESAWSLNPLNLDETIILSFPTSPYPSLNLAGKRWDPPVPATSLIITAPKGLAHKDTRRNQFKEWDCGGMSLPRPAKPYHYFLR